MGVTAAEKHIGLMPAEYFGTFMADAADIFFIDAEQVVADHDNFFPAVVQT
ncbi:hypothetical protein SDC9_194938 [bioreactor metagenome]|uniref:Uncharacterized protein n=1 Tax=bioreactor metagenome TaxID=1076179 RepID=A0A645I8T9_9ZZZZ